MNDSLPLPGRLTEVGRASSSVEFSTFTSPKDDKIDILVASTHPNIRKLPSATWTARLATALALMAVLFTISHCRSWSLRATGTKPVARRLASSEEGDDQHKSTTSLVEHACEEQSKWPEEEEEVPVERQQPGGGITPEEKAATDDDPREKGKRHGASDFAYGSPEKRARVSEGHLEPQRIQEGLHPRIFFPALLEGSSESLAQAPAETSELPEEMLDFYIKEALGAGAHLSFEPWLLDPSESLPPSPFGAATEEKEEDEAQESSAAGDPASRGAKLGNEATDLAPSTAQGLLLKQAAPFDEGAFEGLQTSRPSSHPTKRRRKTASPSTSSGSDWSPTLPPKPVDHLRHPFYHLPEVPDSVAQRALTFTPRINTQPRMHMMKHLTLARELLAKPVVTADDIQQLLNEGETLAHFASAHMSRAIGGSKSSDFLAALSLRFIVADTLWCVCTVVGPAMRKDQWWRALMDKMLAQPHSWFPSSKGEGIVASRRELTERLIQTLDTYKEGRRPDAKTVVQMKQEILCGKYMLTEFKHPQWNPWRQADKEFRDAS